MVGRVWLETAGERDSGIDETVVLSGSIAAASGVGVSSSDSDSESLPSSDEDSYDPASESNESADIRVSG